jgi:cellulose synthase/poly-beta-1,6-N-acetylglucosamine synthase-like glycosyltransferase
MTGPAVSVVVPVYNGARTIAACLEAIGRQEFDGETELIVVDNGSTDATAAIIARYGFARMVACATRGPAAARNAGIAAARHPVIAFTDSDCVPGPGWLTALTAALRPDIGGVGGRLESIARGPVQDVVAAISFDQRQAIESSLPYVITANCLFRREALAAVDGFDETFPIAGGEDTDLGWRMTAGGARFAYADGAVCLHNHPTRLLDLMSQRVRYGYAMSLLWIKHRGGPFGPALGVILPSWSTLCLSLARPGQVAGSGTSRALHAWANAAYFAGWMLGAGERAASGSSRPPAPVQGDRRAIVLASPIAALACATTLAAMLVTGRLRRYRR